MRMRSLGAIVLALLVFGGSARASICELSCAMDGASPAGEQKAPDRQSAVHNQGKTALQAQTDKADCADGPCVEIVGTTRVAGSVAATIPGLRGIVAEHSGANNGRTLSDLLASNLSPQQLLDCCCRIILRV